MDKEQVNEWLRDYMAAWESYDPAQVAGLFTDDAEYRYYPYEDAIVGGRAIADSWREEGRRDEPNSYKAHYECVAADGDIAVATGESIYFKPNGSLDDAFDNCFVMRFASDGRCASFTEYYVKRPAPKP